MVATTLADLDEWAFLQQQRHTGKENQRSECEDFPRIISLGDVTFNHLTTKLSHSYGRRTEQCSMILRFHGRVKTEGEVAVG